TSRVRGVPKKAEKALSRQLRGSPARIASRSLAANRSLGMRSCGRTNLGPPILEPSLEPIEDRNRYKTARGENQNAEEHHIGLKGIAGIRDQVSDAGRRSIKLADDHAEQRTSGAIL